MDNNKSEQRKQIPAIRLTDLLIIDQCYLKPDYRSKFPGEGSSLFGKYDILSVFELKSFEILKPREIKKLFASLPDDVTDCLIQDRRREQKSVERKGREGREEKECEIEGSQIQMLKEKKGDLLREKYFLQREINEWKAKKQVFEETQHRMRSFPAVHNAFYPHSYTHNTQFTNQMPNNSLQQMHYQHLPTMQAQRELYYMQTV